jgi:hypothetical protein
MSIDVHFHIVPILFLEALSACGPIERRMAGDERSSRRSDSISHETRNWRLTCEAERISASGTRPPGLMGDHAKGRATCTRARAGFCQQSGHAIADLQM